MTTITILSRVLLIAAVASVAVYALLPNRKRKDPR